MAVSRVAGQGGRSERRVLTIAERAQATCRDILVERTAGVPGFVPAANGQPTALRFGAIDQAFGHALVLISGAHPIRSCCTLLHVSRSSLLECAGKAYRTGGARAE